MKSLLCLAILLVSQVSQAQTRFYQAESGIWTQQICNYPKPVPDPYDPNPRPRQKPLTETAMEDACNESLNKCYLEFNKEFPDTEFTCEVKNGKTTLSQTVYNEKGSKYCKYVHKVNTTCLTQAIAKEK